MHVKNGAVWNRGFYYVEAHFLAGRREQQAEFGIVVPPFVQEERSP